MEPEFAAAVETAAAELAGVLVTVRTEGVDRTADEDLAVEVGTVEVDLLERRSLPGSATVDGLAELDARGLASAVSRGGASRAGALGRTGRGVLRDLSAAENASGSTRRGRRLDGGLRVSAAVGNGACAPTADCSSFE